MGNITWKIYLNKKLFDKLGDLMILFFSLYIHNLSYSQFLNYFYEFRKTAYFTIILAHLGLVKAQLFEKFNKEINLKDFWVIQRELLEKMKLIIFEYNKISRSNFLAKFNGAVY